MPQTINVYPVEYDLWHDTLALFEPFASEPWAMLLDSASAQHPDSRYDILVRQPVQTIRLINNKVICQPPLSNDHHERLDLFSTIQAALKPFKNTHSELPFSGGALGYLGYDVARALTPELFQQAPDQAANDIPLPDAAIGIYTHALVIDHEAKQSFIVAPANMSKASAEQFWRAPATPYSPFKLTSSWVSNLTEAQYYDRLKRFHGYREAGVCEQINLAQRFTASCTGSNWHAYTKMRSVNGAPFSGFVQLEEGAVLSLSPERFVQVNNQGHVQTKPIKGTRPRHSDPSKDAASAAELLASEKERNENLMIVELLSNDIRQVCKKGSVQTPQLLALESFPAVHHLVSTVVGELEDHYTALDLMRAIFPGGSIAGNPKQRAVEIINELEPHRRSVYCGSLVYFSANGQTDSSVTIRTLCQTGKQLHCWAGGGIVADSKASEEYQETFDKVARILPLL